ncbi:MAG: DUF1598 domain-containing protein, partial [Planctomycetota bacterium]
KGTNMKFQSLTQAAKARNCVFLPLAWLLISLVCIDAGIAQQMKLAIHQQLDSHLSFGEFGKAIEMAAEFPEYQRDIAFKKISLLQNQAGSYQSAMQTADSISTDHIRFRALTQIHNVGTGTLTSSEPFGQPDSESTEKLNGGVTEADFQPLINLIRSTIGPDTWDDVGGDGTMLAYPAGVYVDTSGTLKKIKIENNKSLKKLAKWSASSSSVTKFDEQVELRTISLKGLEKRAQRLAAECKPIDASLRNMAGIYEIDFVAFVPETNDVVIGGPAGPWELDVDGHAINKKTGKPVLQLDDLVVCLRNSQPSPLGNFGKFGCSITPRQANLEETQKFLSTSKLKGKAWRETLRSTLGMQDIEVFGIDPATHAGRVLIEADYRMKLVAMGLEPSIAEIPSYLERLNGKLADMDVVRWWFTMNYDEITSDEKGHIYQLEGTGVRVLSENEFIDQQGNRIHTGASSGPTAGFARDFTTHFDKIADEYPVYRRLKNLFDLAIVSSLIRHKGLDKKANWELTYFGNHPDYQQLTHAVSTARVPTQVASVMNHRTIRQRKANSTVKHTLVGVSGGITFDAIEVIRQKSEIGNSGEFESRLTMPEMETSASWWWD